MSTRLALTFLVLLGASARAADRPERLIADFEGDGFAPWTTTGTAFGGKPASGALPGQMAVEGFSGRGLASSFHGGDDAVGTLTSPPFPIERPWINLLVGGGKYPGETCVNLVVDGKPVRTATGPNNQPGGSERLGWQSWDVTDLAGKTATIEVVDRRKGGWGHISVDQIVQGDRPRQEQPATRDLVVSRRWLNLPVKNGAPKRRVALLRDGKPVREFEIELAEAAPDFWTFLDLAPFQGQTLTIRADALPEGSTALMAVGQADQIEGGDAHDEADRPLYHFTSLRGWLNDPNGLVFHEGEYHLFYQHNPYGWPWGNMHWGHAVSPDLVRWRELPNAIYPYRYGDWAFSGSAVVDTANTAGFQAGSEPPIVAAYTSTGRGECIAWSHDRGRTFHEFGGNPVVRHEGRDPKLLWHAASKQWVMAVYDERDGKQWIVFHTSPDLKTWTERSRIDGFFECPDLFELPVRGSNPARSLWVLYAADARYVLGQFDGATFRPETGKLQVWHGDFYAAQTFNNSPDGRRVQIGWGRDIAFPGMPFNQQMAVPVELTLRETPAGVRMHAEPVAELSKLKGAGGQLAETEPKAGRRPLPVAPGRSLAIEAEITLGTASQVGFDLGVSRVTYDVAKRQLNCNGKTAPLEPVDGRVQLQILADTGSVEAFGNHGRVAISASARRPAVSDPPAFFAEGGVARLDRLEAHAMQSSWTLPQLTGDR